VTSQARKAQVNFERSQGRDGPSAVVVRPQLLHRTTSRKLLANPGGPLYNIELDCLFDISREEVLAATVSACTDLEGLTDCREVRWQRAATGALGCQGAPHETAVGAAKLIG
jgi:hypothetical protein